MSIDARHPKETWEAYRARLRMQATIIEGVKRGQPATPGDTREEPTDQPKPRLWEQWVGILMARNRKLSGEPS